MDFYSELHRAFPVYLAQTFSASDRFFLCKKRLGQLNGIGKPASAAKTQKRIDTINV